MMSGTDQMTPPPLICAISASEFDKFKKKNRLNHIFLQNTFFSKAYENITQNNLTFLKM